MASSHHIDLKAGLAGNNRTVLLKNVVGSFSYRAKSYNAYPRHPSPAVFRATAVPSLSESTESVTEQFLFPGLLCLQARTMTMLWNRARRIYFHETTTLIPTVQQLTVQS